MSRHLSNEAHGLAHWLANGAVLAHIYERNFGVASIGQDIDIHPASLQANGPASIQIPHTQTHTKVAKLINAKPPPPPRPASPDFKVSRSLAGLDTGA